MLGLRVAHCVANTIELHNAGGERTSTALCVCESGFSVSNCFDCNPGRTDGRVSSQPCTKCDSGTRATDCFCDVNRTGGSVSQQPCSCGSKFILMKCLQCNTKNAGNAMCPGCEQQKENCKCVCLTCTKQRGCCACSSFHCAPVEPRGSIQAARREKQQIAHEKAKDKPKFKPAIAYFKQNEGVKRMAEARQGGSEIWNAMKSKEKTQCLAQMWREMSDEEKEVYNEDPRPKRSSKKQKIREKIIDHQECNQNH